MGWGQPFETSLDQPAEPWQAALMTNTNHNHMTTFRVVLDDVTEDRVIAVAKASVEPLVGPIEIESKDATGPTDRCRTWKVRFYGLNVNEADRTTRIIRGAIEPLVDALGPKYLCRA